MKYQILILFLISFILSNDINTENTKNIGLETKQELPTWGNKYPKSIGLGFGTSSPFNSNLISYSEQGQGSNKWFLTKYNNFYNFNFQGKEINISLLGGTENFYLINNFSFWSIFSIQLLDLINIGIGTGANIVLHQFEYEETSLGLIFNINTPLPLHFYNTNYTIGLNFKHIFTKYESVDLLGPYNSQIFNFYINFEIPVESLSNYFN